MGKKKKRRNTTTENNPTLEDYINNIDINLANLEKFGALLLSFGYSNYIVSANLDILDINEINDTGLTPDQVIIFAQTFVFLGYITLFVVACRRLETLIFENEVEEKDRPLTAYETVQFSYGLSVYANLLRLQAFIEIEKINKGGIIIE